MYTDKPELYLKHKGSLINPQEEDKSITSKQHDMKIQDMKLEYELQEKQWKSCCFQLEPQSSLFFGKLFISILIIALCSYQLITLSECSYQSLYSSILSSIITYWLSTKK